MGSRQLLARKMAAALQHSSTSSGRPILLRNETQGGHGSRAISRYVALGADKLVFLDAGIKFGSSSS